MCTQPQAVGVPQPWTYEIKNIVSDDAIIFATLALPMAAQAQGTVRGAQEGAAQGEHDAGPIGAVVGGTLGAVAGTIGGILGIDDRPRFRTYVINERHPSYRYESVGGGGIVAHWSGGDLRPRRSKIQPVISPRSAATEINASTKSPIATIVRPTSSPLSIRPKFV